MHDTIDPSSSTSVPATRGTTTIQMTRLLVNYISHSTAVLYKRVPTTIHTTYILVNYIHAIMIQLSKKSIISTSYIPYYYRRTHIEHAVPS